MLGVSLLGLGACAGAPATPALLPAAPLNFAVDLHAHVTMGRAVPFFSGEPGKGPLANSPAQQWVNQIDVPSLRAAGIGAVVAAIWAPPALRPGRTAMDETLGQVDALRAFAVRNPAFVIAQTARDLRRAVPRRVGLLPSLEGAEAISSVDDVDTLYAAGVRVIGLVHFTDNAVADAEDGQFGSALGLFLDGRAGGLSDLGRAAVRRMIALGVLVDLAHASHRSIDDVLAITEEARVPVIFSHAGSGMAQVRTLNDEQAARIVRGGGLIGIGVFRSDLLKPVPDSDRWPGYVEGTCDEVVAHWLHYASLVGANHVVLGSDLSSVIARGAPGGSCPNGMRHAGDLPHVFAALERRGIPRSSMDEGGSRFLTLLEVIESRADPDAQFGARKRRRPTTAHFRD